MKYVVLKKTKLEDFIKLLRAKQKVVAPVRKGYDNFAFEEITSAADMALTYIPTILPPKKYFMPQHETLLEFELTKGQDMKAVVEVEPLVLFAVHTCDLAGIQCLNVVFADRPKDQNYLIRKNKIIIIGLECNQYCDEFASCTLMNNHLPNGGYELFMTDIGDSLIIHVATQLGEQLTSDPAIFEQPTKQHLAALEQVRTRKKEIFKNEVDVKREAIPDLFDKSLNAEVWNDNGRRCLACGNCTNVCPTCYCFDVMDELNLDLKSGKRVRVWDSCQNERFAKVASGESFRHNRSQRQRHRFFRKFKYPVARHGRFFCTGCGRCSRTCMACINLKETLTALVKENR